MKKIFKISQSEYDFALAKAQSGSCNEIENAILNIIAVAYITKQKVTQSTYIKFRNIKNNHHENNN